MLSPKASADAANPDQQGDVPTQAPACHNGDVAVVVLHPGDLLYVPPLTYHQVESLDSRSISVNVWSHSAPESLLDRVLYGIALPFDGDDPRWSSDAVFRAVKAFEYLEHVLPNNDREEMPSDSSAVAPALRAWHRSRWASFGESTAKWQSDLRAMKIASNLEGKTALGTLRQEKYASRASRVRSVFAEVSARHTQILLWNFADSVITYSLGEVEETGNVVASWIALL